MKCQGLERLTTAAPMTASSLNTGTTILNFMVSSQWWKIHIKIKFKFFFQSHSKFDLESSLYEIIIF